ncbi:MAG: sugar ABC transporter substrate-binding protein [Anaerolineae bacterium]|nr:sugar ABC transporter substrate-binding protein [Anaerolineae bacterium]
MLRRSVTLLVLLALVTLAVPVMAQETEPTIPAAPCVAPGELTLWLWDENWAEVIGDSVELWKTEYCPDAEVTIEVNPWGQYWDLLKTAAASGDLPDIFTMSQPNAFFYIDNNALMDLEPYFEAAGIDSNLWGSGSVGPYRGADGTGLYSAPVEWVTVAVYYNKDMMDAAGLEYPTADWTWDDFAEYAAALTDEEAGVYGAEVYMEYQSGFPNWIAMTGVSPLIEADRSRCTLQDAGSIEALQFLKGLADAGYMPPPSIVGSTSPDDAFNLFKSGQLAMMSVGAWKLPQAFEELEFNWDVVTFPKNPTTGRSRSTLHAVGYSAGANAENPDLVANLIQFLVSDEGQRFFAEAGGVAPGNPNPELQQMWIDSFGDTNVNIQAFIDAIQDSQGITDFDEIDSVNNELVLNIFDLGMSVEEATAKACEVIDAYIASMSE